MTNEAAAISPELIEEAKQLLADAIGCPVKSDTDLDLSDRDQVFTDVAVEAIAKALNTTRSPVLSDEQMAAIPVEFYQWLYKIERDVRVWDLTPNEISGLIEALSRSPVETNNA